LCRRMTKMIGKKQRQEYAIADSALLAGSLPRRAETVVLDGHSSLIEKQRRRTAPHSKPTGQDERAIRRPLPRVGEGIGKRPVVQYLIRALELKAANALHMGTIIGDAMRGRFSLSSWSPQFPLSHELIPNPVHCQDELRVVRVGLDLLAQPGHVNVDR